MIGLLLYIRTPNINYMQYHHIYLILPPTQLKHRKHDSKNDLVVLTYFMVNRYSSWTEFSQVRNNCSTK